MAVNTNVLATVSGALRLVNLSASFKIVIPPPAGPPPPPRPGLDPPGRGIYILKLAERITSLDADIRRGYCFKGKRQY